VSKDEPDIDTQHVLSSFLISNRFSPEHAAVSCGRVLPQLSSNSQQNISAHEKHYTNVTDSITCYGGFTALNEVLVLAAPIGRKINITPKK